MNIFIKKFILLKIEYIKVTFYQEVKLQEVVVIRIEQSLRAVAQESVLVRED